MTITSDKSSGMNSIYELMQIARVLDNGLSRGLSSELAPYRITIAEFSVISVLYFSEREHTVTELSDMLAVNMSHVSRVANELVDAGLLSKRRLRCDRRVAPMKLTQQGSDLAVNLHKSLQSYERRVTDGIAAKDLRTCLTVIRMILNQI